MNARTYIIGYKSQERVTRLCESIPEAFREATTLIDNSPTPQLQIPFGRLIVRPGDGLFTSAFNWALADAATAGDIAIILNDDLILEPDCLERLVAAIERGVGIAVPVQVDMRNPSQVVYGSSGPAYPAGVHYGGPREMYPEDRPQAWATFAAVAIHPTLPCAIGVLDPFLRMFYSDSDYSLRAALAGWSIMLIHDAVVRHEMHAASSAEPAGQIRNYMIADQSIFESRWGGEQLRRLSLG